MSTVPKPVAICITLVAIGFMVLGFATFEIWGLERITAVLDNAASKNKLGPLPAMAGEHHEMTDLKWLLDKDVSGLDVPPPGKLQQDSRVIAAFIDPEMMFQACGDQAAVACAQPWDKSITMPNPCSFAETDPYAHLLCHELGHVSGWNHPGRDVKYSEGSALVRDAIHSFQRTFDRHVSEVEIMWGRSLDRRKQRCWVRHHTIEVTCK